MDWVCENAWKGAFSQGMFSAGGVVGTLVFGFTADHLGRKMTFFMTNSLLAIAALMTPWFESFVAFTAIRFIMGMANLTFYNIFFLLSTSGIIDYFFFFSQSSSFSGLEYVTIEKRAFISNLSLAIGITIGGVIQPWLIKWVGDWRTFNFILYIQCSLLLITPFFLHESVRWLASQGRVDECLVILNKIAKTNGHQFTPEIEAGFKVPLF